MRRKWVFLQGAFVASVVVAASASTVGDSHGKVQLWVGGPFWATTNVGADNPWDFGLYFWWGDTVGYRRMGDAWVASDWSSRNFSFSQETVPIYSATKSLSTFLSEGWVVLKEGTYVLAPERDAAQVHWGGSWRIPTKKEFEDLRDKCDWTWTTMNGVDGFVVRGRGDFASASIFLPAAGFGEYTRLESVGYEGYYRSSVPSGSTAYPGPIEAWFLWLYNDLRNPYSTYPYYFYAVSSVHGVESLPCDGFSVRPVQNFVENESESVFRFYSRAYKGHFFTIDEDEMWTIRETNPNWRYEGTAYRAFSEKKPGTLPLYRFYSKFYKGHFFTIDEYEMRIVRNTNPNWKYEGIAYYVYPDAVEGTVPVFRFWSKRYRHHFYTTNEAEKNDLIAHNPNWKYEDIAFYALPAEATGQGRAVASGAPEGGAFGERALPEAEGDVPDGGAPGGRALPLVIRGAGVFPMGAWAIEVREEAPDAEELSAGLNERPTPSAFPTLHVALPEGAAAVSLWSASVGPVSETANPGPETEFIPEATGIWHWLRAVDEKGKNVLSLWIRLLP